MNCHSAQPLLSAERDGTLTSGERADLEAHVAGCAECLRFRTLLAEAGDHLRTTAARVKVPDEERAWQDIHREIRGLERGAARPWWQLGRWTMPLGAVAAAVAVMAIFAPSLAEDDDDAPESTVARAEFVDVGDNASSVVYVDDKSGWLVVWAAPGAKSG